MLAIYCRSSLRASINSLVIQPVQVDTIFRNLVLANLIIHNNLCVIHSSDGKPLSKKAVKKQQKEAEKAKKKAETAARLVSSGTSFLFQSIIPLCTIPTILCKLQYSAEVEITGGRWSISSHLACQSESVKASEGQYNFTPFSRTSLDLEEQSLCAGIVLPKILCSDLFCWQPLHWNPGNVTYNVTYIGPLKCGTLRHTMCPLPLWYTAS